MAYEDAGARWVFPVWKADMFLSDPTRPPLSPEFLTQLTATAKDLNQPLAIPADPAARAQTDADLFRLTTAAQRWLEPRPAPRLRPGLLQDWLAHQGVLEIETRFATSHVSNPNAGEYIKAHRIALAHLGLAPFEGRLLRDKEQLEGPNALSLRKTHILARLAFLRACHSGQTQIPLFRTIYSDAPLTPPRATGFVSTTYDRAVAERFLTAAQSKPYRALLSENIPVGRLFMTHHETQEMKAPYDEAEALLIASTGPALF